MDKKLRRLLFVLLALALLISGGYLAYKAIEARSAARDYEGALRAAGIGGLTVPSVPPAPSAPSTPQPSEGPGEEPENGGEGDPWLEALKAVNLSDLRDVNSDVLGWITIPDTELSYPVLACEDNGYYLNHTWSGERNAAGAIFLEQQCARDFSDFNVIVYGHRMHNNMMFGTLRFYEGADYWREHPSVYLVSDAGVARYDIFAAYEAGVRTQTYRLGLAEEGEKQEFLDYCVGKSVLDTGVVPATSEQVLTLSTCTRQGGAYSRWVVQAVLRETA